MPKSKKSDTDSSEYDSDSDSGPDDRIPPPPAKKSKASEKKSNKEPAKTEAGKSKTQSSKTGAEKSKSESTKDVEGGAKGPWVLEGMRQVRINEFRGRKMVDIREFYAKNGETLPGKKGICLSVTQWLKLLEIADVVTAAVRDQ